MAGVSQSYPWYLTTPGLHDGVTRDRRCLILARQGFLPCSKIRNRITYGVHPPSTASVSLATSAFFPVLGPVWHGIVPTAAGFGNRSGLIVPFQHCRYHLQDWRDSQMRPENAHERIIQSSPQSTSNMRRAGVWYAQTSLEDYPETQRLSILSRIRSVLGHRR